MTHFYTKTASGDVEPRHFVKMAKDPTRTRASRITDARKAKKESGEIWYASVTTVLNVLDKPALVNWKVDKHLEQAYQIDFGGLASTYEEFNKKVKALTREEMDKAPTAGTNIHQVLEDYLWERVDTFASDTEQLIIRNVESALDVCGIDNDCLYAKERYFIDSDYGFAGCADLVVTTQDGENWVIDYKSKQTADKFKPGKMAYPEHYRQLAAYGKAIFGGEDFRAANIFICLETGEVDFHEHKPEDLDRGWADFKDCLSIYKRNSYDANA